MTAKTISVDIVSSNALYVYVKFPFLDIPVQMTYSFFFKRMTGGYLKIKKRSARKMKELLIHLGKNNQKNRS